MHSNMATQKTKVLLSALVAVMIAFSIWGAYQYPKAQISAGASPTGATFGDAKIAMVSMAPATSAASSTSIQNTDGNDRKIERYIVDCSNVGTSQTYLTGAGLTSTGWFASFATSSTAAQVTNASAQALPLSTSTPDVYNTLGTGTTTPTAAQRVWAAGSYLIITFNATNTASCTAGVSYIAS